MRIVALARAFMALYEPADAAVVRQVAIRRGSDPWISGWRWCRGTPWAIGTASSSGRAAASSTGETAPPGGVTTSSARSALSVHGAEILLIGGPRASENEGPAGPVGNAQCTHARSGRERDEAEASPCGATE